VALVVASLMVSAAVYGWGGMDDESNVFKFFYLDHEHNLPAWFQGSTLFACGMLLLLIGLAWRATIRRGFGTTWVLLGLVFVGLSIDEIVSIHEQSMQYIHVPQRFDWGIFYYPWVIPASVLVGTLVVFLIPFLKSLPVPTLRRFLLAGAVYMTGVVGMEMVGGSVRSRDDEPSLSSVLVMTTEETLEMIGMAIFLYAILSYIAAYAASIQISDLDAVD
jgi:hypothetical protein